MTTQSALLDRDLAHLIHPLHNRALQAGGHVWVKGEGAILTDADGKEYIDALSGLWNVAAGHGRKELAAAAARQMETLAFCTGYAGSSNPNAIELAERLAGLTYPSINRFFFTSGGGESSDTAFKTARYYWKLKGQPQKTKVISRQWGYHGVTLAAMSATGIASYWPMFEPRVPGFVQIASPYPYRYQAPAGVSPGIAAGQRAGTGHSPRGGRNGRHVFGGARAGGRRSHCAAGRLFPPHPANLRQVWRPLRGRRSDYRLRTHGEDVRPGHWGVEPDMIIFAKSITSGYFPLGGIGVSDRLAEVLTRPRMSGCTPTRTAPIPSGVPWLWPISTLSSGKTSSPRRGRRGPGCSARLKDALGDHPHVGEVRGLGLMCAIEYVKDRATGKSSNRKKKSARASTRRPSHGAFSAACGETSSASPRQSSPANNNWTASPTS